MFSLSSVMFVVVKNLLKSVMSIVYCVDVMLIPLILCRPTIEIRNLLTYCHTFIKLVMRTGSYIKTVTNLLMTIFFGHCIDIIRRNLMLINLLRAKVVLQRRKTVRNYADR